MNYKALYNLALVICFSVTISTSLFLKYLRYDPLHFRAFMIAIYSVWNFFSAPLRLYVFNYIYIYINSDEERVSDPEDTWPQSLAVKGTTNDRWASNSAQQQLPAGEQAWREETPLGGRRPHYTGVLTLLRGHLWPHRALGLRTKDDKVKQAHGHSVSNSGMDPHFSIILSFSQLTTVFSVPWTVSVS